MVENLPSIETLEAVHRFPCRFTFKVIGKVENGFAAKVVSAVREELAIDADPPFSLRQTPNGRHVSVTLEPMVSESQQVLNIYRRIRQLPGLVMLM